LKQLEIVFSNEIKTCHLYNPTYEAWRTNGGNWAMNILRIGSDKCEEDLEKARGEVDHAESRVRAKDLEIASMVRTGRVRLSEVR
jgi:hypothetical protein